MRRRWLSISARAAPGQAAEAATSFLHRLELLALAQLAKRL